MLESRYPGSGKENTGVAPEEETERELENEITRLQHESRMWRVANHVFWILWGVQKAKVPGLPDFDDPTQSAAVAAGPKSMNISMSSGNLQTLGSPIAEEVADPVDGGVKVAEEAEEEEEEDEFDYLGYTWQRAMFFWGDAVSLGLVKKEDLPRHVQENLKMVEN